MDGFRESRSALGYFWQNNKPDNKWPGRVYIDQFPKVDLHCLDRAPGDGEIPRGSQTVLGITDDNQYVTMLEALLYERGLATSTASSTYRIGATSNFMLVGKSHFSNEKSVKRLTFASSIIQHVEMRQGTRGSKPLDKSTFKELRNNLIEALEQFATGHEDSEFWIDLMRARIARLNSHDTKITIINFIKDLPKYFVDTELSFPKDVTQLRHALTHELTRFTAKDQLKLNYYISKLKALFVLNDAILLGASREEISPVSAFFVAAKYPFHSYDDDTVDDDLEDTLEAD
jgi:hypothetical protein